MRIISLFSGIGAYEKALRNIGIEYELVKYCEISKDKSKAYSLMHKEPESKNMWDIREIGEIKDNNIDLVVYSPPCQTYSKVGKREGSKVELGRLFYDALRVIGNVNPKYCLMENVGNLSSQFKNDFDEMLKALENLGYDNYFKVINAKDFIPQNRERVFVLSIKKELGIKGFEFPEGKNEEKWYEYINPLEGREMTNKQKIAIEVCKGLRDDMSVDISGAMDFENSVITLRQNRKKELNGKIGKYTNCNLRFQNNREYPTILAHYGTAGGCFTVMAYKGNLSGITPRQCFKLMGFEYEDCDLLIESGFSKSKLYEMAGDSIVVKVLEEIFKKLFSNRELI